MIGTNEFREAIQSIGLIPPDSIEPGRLHRFPGAGKRNGNTAAWCKLFPDGIGGVYGDHSQDISAHWQAARSAPFTPAEREAFNRQIAEAKASAEAERKQRQSEAADKAASIWQAATPAPIDHAYLTRKGIKPHGSKLHNGALVIAVREGADIHSLQFINENGAKRFLKDGRVAGGYFSIGATKGAEALCIAEGFATGATIHELTGYPVAVAFNAGNLEAVAIALRAKLPDMPIIVCADDDLTAGNPGRTKGTAAALAISARLALPDFGDARAEDATDFNDLATHCGAEAVKRAIAAAAIPARETYQAASVIASNDDIEAWPEPLPLPNALPAVQAFDFDLLPDSLRPWIEDIAERVQCPPDFPAVGAMISLAAGVGRKIGIRPKRQDDWLEVPNLWGAIIGRPGVMKSPALRASMQPLARLEAKARAGYESELADWQRGQELHKLKREGAKANIVKLLRGGKEVGTDALPDDFAEDQPQARRYVVNDCSVEALGEILRGNPNGTLAYRDELIGLLKSLDKEGNEGARGFFLSAWSGTDAYTFDRIGRGLNMRIDACCLSLLGSIQPAIIGGYLRQTVSTGGGDGLLSRFQLLVWPEIAGEWRNVDRWPDTDAKAKAYAVFERLDTLDSTTIGATIDDGGIPYLRFDADAQELFTEWRADFEPRIRSGNDHAAFESHLSKYRKLVPSLALLIHLADKTTGAIGSKSLLKALAWAEYLESHARRAYASVTQAEAESARALLHRIKRGEIANPFVPRDVYLKHWANLSKPEEVHDAVRFLCDLDYLRKEDQPTGGRPKVVIWINPKARAR